MKQTKSIVMIGGMGPQASATALDRLVRRASELQNSTGVAFPEIIVLSLPVPEFISSHSNIGAAKRMIVREVRKASVFRPCVVMMACNTAHILFDDIKSRLPDLPFVSLISAVVEEVEKRGVQRIGLLASPTTIRNKLYQTELESRSIDCVLPDKDKLKSLEMMIRQTIASTGSPDRHLLRVMAQEMLEKGCSAVLLGCTELPVIYGETDNPRILDSISVLCDRLLEEYQKSAIMEKI